MNISLTTLSTVCSMNPSSCFRFRRLLFRLRRLYSADDLTDPLLADLEELDQPPLRDPRVKASMKEDFPFNAISHKRTQIVHPVKIGYFANKSHNQQGCELVCDKVDIRQL